MLCLEHCTLYLSYWKLIKNNNFHVWEPLFSFHNFPLATCFWPNTSNLLFFNYNKGLVFPSCISDFFGLGGCLCQIDRVSHRPFVLFCITCLCICSVHLLFVDVHLPEMWGSLLMVIFNTIFLSSVKLLTGVITVRRNTFSSEIHHQICKSYY